MSKPSYGQKAYERGFIDGMQKQMQSSVDKAVNGMNKVFREVVIEGFALRFYPSDNGWMCGIANEMMDALEKSQRTWVGLTDEEIDELEDDRSLETTHDFICAIEAKLKEKNQ